MPDVLYELGQPVRPGKLITEERVSPMPANVYECMFLLDTNKVSGDVPAAAGQLHGQLERHAAEILASRITPAKLAMPRLRRVYSSPNVCVKCGAASLPSAAPFSAREIATMANLNKVMLIGRLTRDPEVRTFANGGKVAKFGFAVNNRRKNTTTGQWEDDPVFLDMEAFNRGDSGRQLADVVEQHFRKGRQFFIE